MKESVVSWMQEGQCFGVEEAFTENPRKDKTERFYTCKVVSYFIDKCCFRFENPAKEDY